MTDLSSSDMKKTKLFFKILLLLLSIASCQKKGSEKESAAIFRVIHPIVSDTVYIKEYAADIHSRQNVEIHARVKGYLEGTYVDEGQHVKAGQILFSISSQRFKEELAKANAAVKSAIANAKSAEIEVKNVKALVEQGIVSESELEMEQAKLDAANANIEAARSNESTAKLNLLLTEIRAPFDGIIDRIPYKAGSLIDEDALLTTISDNKEVFAYFNVSESEYLNIISQSVDDQEQDVDLVMANNVLYPSKGIIETVEGEFDKNTGNIAFRARFKNPNGILKNGSSGKIQLRNKLRKALLVPQKSTFEIQDKIYVFVVDKKNVVQLRPITPQFRLPMLYVVSSGVSSSDRIVYEGIQQLKAGDTIRTESEQLRELLAQEKN